MNALADTGATHTILPLEFAQELGIRVDLDERIDTQVAGGGRCYIYPAAAPIDYRIRDPEGSAVYGWSGEVFFALEQEFVLLGHHQCLERLDVTFKGPERYLEITPRVRTRSIGRRRRLG